MKKLEELGISPAPWKIVPSANNEMMNCDGVNREVMEIHCTPARNCESWRKIAVVRFQAGGPETANANMIEASPDMYSALSELYDSVCMRCEIRRQCEYYNQGGSMCEIMANARAALAKAAGESEVKHD